MSVLLGPLVDHHKYADVHDTHGAERQDETQQETDEFELGLGGELDVALVCGDGADAVVEDGVPEQNGGSVDTRYDPDDGDGDHEVLVCPVLSVAERVGDGEVPVQRHGHQVPN